MKSKILNEQNDWSKKMQRPQKQWQSKLILLADLPRPKIDLKFLFFIAHLYQKYISKPSLSP